jgi:hypothetical protein
MSNEDWLIAKSGAIAPPSGRLLAAGYLVRVVRGSSTRDVAVEFANSSAVVSVGYAEEVARRFLRDAEPPRQLLVEVSGSVSVVVGPREPTGDEPDPVHQRIHAEPRRARTRRRGASAL